MGLATGVCHYYSGAGPSPFAFFFFEGAAGVLFPETTGVALGASTCLTGSATGAGAGFGVSTIAFGASATGAAFGA